MASLAKKKAKSLAKILSEAMQQHFLDVDQ
jgi:hypothetical protein